MKIEEIESLNKHRTKGKWTNRGKSGFKIGSKSRYIKTDAKIGGYDCVLKKDNLILTKDRSGNDASFITAAPTITEQYIKARRFEVTDSFILKVSEKIKRHPFAKVPMSDIDQYRLIFETALETLWEEEIEND
jgi:hypothetical protein